MTSKIFDKPSEKACTGEEQLVNAVAKVYIDEIAKDLCSKYTACTCSDKNGRCSVPQQHARIIYELGYRKHARGQWSFACVHDDKKFYRCSNCWHAFPFDNVNYCPSCGAHMQVDRSELDV